MEGKYRNCFYVLLLIVQLVKEHDCYQLTGVFGCQDRYIWMIDGSVSCNYLTHPSKYSLHINPKYYCTEYPLTRCCKTCAVLERNNYGTLNGVYEQTTHVPTTAPTTVPTSTEMFTSVVAEIKPKQFELKTFFTIPLLRKQEQTTMSPQTRRTLTATTAELATTKSPETKFVTKPMQTLTFMTETAGSRRTLPASHHHPNTKAEVDQLFTLPQEIRSSGRLFPTMVTSKYTSRAADLIPSAEPTAKSETYSTLILTEKTQVTKQVTPTSQPRTTPIPSVSTTALPPTLSSTTTSPPTSPSTTTSPPTSPSTTTTPPTSPSTSTPSTSSATTLTTRQNDVLKRNCRDIGIWLISGSVPCGYLTKDNKYGLNKNQLYFCNRYPLTSCCETCERINRENGK